MVDALARDDLSFADYTRRVHASPLGRSLRTRRLAARLIYGVRSPLLHRLVWWHMGPVMRRFILKYVFNWARPGLAG